MSSRSIFDIPGKQKRMGELETMTAASDFWLDPERAKAVVGEISSLKAWLAPVASLRERVLDLETLLEMAEEEGGEAEVEAVKELAVASKALDDLEFRKMLSGKDDERNAILSVHPGAGGTDSQDWAQMLFRMYMAWTEKRGFSAEVMDIQSADEAGIKSATVLVKGSYAYGYLKAEIGVHRLVRLSPFDANHRRHTSFASVAVYPEVDEETAIEVSESDIRTDVFGASGPGGQHVNKSSTAIRLTHLPTGIVVNCQSERSQFRNRENAMKVLKARLYAVREDERRKEQQAKAGEKLEIAWGSQIRSYVLHPYQMVKDNRTGVETSDVNGVLDGALDPFIEAFLKATG